MERKTEKSRGTLCSGGIPRNCLLCIWSVFILTLEGISLEKLYEGIRGGGGGVGQSNPSPLLLTSFIRLTRYLAHIMSVLCTFN